jgi:hypothetical protein
MLNERSIFGSVNTYAARVRCVNRSEIHLRLLWLTQRDVTLQFVELSLQPYVFAIKQAQFTVCINR